MDKTTFNTKESAVISTAPIASTGSSGGREKGGGSTRQAKATQEKIPPVRLNPLSKYEEPVHVDGLTLYDIHRKPRNVVGHNAVEGRTCTMVKLPIGKVKSEFHCPVCLKLMKKTTIVMECLHRFCAECIEKCLRIGMKECPSCRVHIPSRRSTRHDVSFDILIAAMFGDLEKFERREEEYLTQINKSKYMNNSSVINRKRGIDKQLGKQNKKRVRNPDSKPQDPKVTEDVSFIHKVHIVILNMHLI